MHTFVPDSLTGIPKPVQPSYVLTDKDRSDLGVAKVCGGVCVGGGAFFTLLLWDASWPLLFLLAWFGALIALAGVTGKRYFRSPADVSLGLTLSYGGGFIGFIVSAGAWAYGVFQ